MSFIGIKLYVYVYVMFQMKKGVSTFEQIWNFQS